MRTSLGLAFVLVAACGTSLPPPGSGTGSGSGGDGVDAGGGLDPGFTPLVMQSWSLEPGQQNYVCVYQTLTQDVWIKEIAPVSPLGTHHSVLMSGDVNGCPNGEANCSFSCSSMLTEPALFASGVGTQPLTMPDGVAIHLKAGDQIFMNLHLFNTSDSDVLTGTSGIQYVSTDPVDPAHEAGVTLAGKAQGLEVPPLASTQTGTCTTEAGHTLFAVAPHMHLLGTHMSVTYGSTTVMDRDYSFDDQTFEDITPAIQSTDGGQYTVQCSYFNPSGNTVPFGESTTDEMCFAMTFMYPPPTQTICVK